MNYYIEEGNDVDDLLWNILREVVKKSNRPLRKRKISLIGEEHKRKVLIFVSL